MISPGTVTASVLPVYLLILAGAFFRKTGVIRREHDDGIMRVIFNVMLPCFILDKILGREILRNTGAVFWGMGLGFSLAIVGIAIGWYCGRLIGLEHGTGRRTFAISAGLQNFGFTAIPVVEILWGGSALAMLFIHNLGFEVAIWSVGVMIMSGETGISWRRLINGPVAAVVIGLLLVALHIDDQITGPGRTALSILGIGAFPLAILITGASMIDQVTAEKPSWRIIAMSCVVRLAIAPFSILLAAKYLPLVTELRQVLVVQAAMPAAMTPILLARLYGGRPAIAIQVVIATTVVSLLTLPWIITWGCRWIGL